MHRYFLRMTVADAALILEALAAFNVTDLGSIGVPGGQKAVRLVETVAGERQVLKVVAVDSVSPDALTRAEREVALLGAIANPNVLKVISPLIKLGSPVHGAAWLEEYLDGNDLGPLLGTTPWTWEEAKRLGVEVSNGLADAHARSVIHRDLSANNIRQLSSGTYKVLDFGFARFTLLTGITFAGQPGTPGYLTPEHINSWSGGPMQMSDVFQVGNLLYRALAAVLPIPYAGNDADYIDRLRRASMTPLSALRPDLTPGQVAVVMRALHPQPARRFINAAALRDALLGTT
jgi:serine/threonine protein kinase